MIKWRLSLRTKNSLIESLGACAVVWHDVVRGVQSIAYWRLHGGYLTAVKVISCVYVGHAATVRCMLWVYFIFPLFPLSVGHAVFFGRICIWTAALAPLLRGHRWMTLPHNADPLLLLIVLVKEGPPVHSTGHLIGVYLCENQMKLLRFFNYKSVKFSLRWFILLRNLNPIRDSDCTKSFIYEFGLIVLILIRT